MPISTFRQKDATPFGFVVDKNHYTDDSLNKLDFDPNDPNKTGIPGTGHSFRIFPLKDSGGNLVRNTYIFGMDYTSNEFANWDYQDNIYLITNITPQDAPALFQPEPGAFKIVVGKREITQIRTAYGQGAPNEVFGILGSMGFLEIAANRGAAAQLLGVNKGSDVSVILGEASAATNGQ